MGFILCLLYDLCMKELELKLTEMETENVRYRQAARAVITKDGKYLFVRSRFGDTKFPGGGVKEDESVLMALKREVKEETGYRVNMDSVKEALLIHERRNDNEAEVLEMDSFYFFCEIEGEQGDTKLDDYEKDYGYETVWLDPHEMIRNNQTAENIPWTPREILAMEELMNEADSETE